MVIEDRSLDWLRIEWYGPIFMYDLNNWLVENMANSKLIEDIWIVFAKIGYHQISLQELRYNLSCNETWSCDPVGSGRRS